MEYFMLAMQNREPEYQRLISEYLSLVENSNAKCAAAVRRRLAFKLVVMII